MSNPHEEVTDYLQRMQDHVNALLRRAEDEFHGIVAKAQVDAYDEAYGPAYEDGYAAGINRTDVDGVFDEGYDEGYREGFNAAKLMAATVVEELQSLYVEGREID